MVEVKDPAGHTRDPRARDRGRPEPAVPARLRGRQGRAAEGQGIRRGLGRGRVGRPLHRGARRGVPEGQHPGQVPHHGGLRQRRNGARIAVQGPRPERRAAAAPQPRPGQVLPRLRRHEHDRLRRPEPGEALPRAGKQGDQRHRRQLPADADRHRAGGLPEDAVRRARPVPVPRPDPVRPAEDAGGRVRRPGPAGPREGRAAGHGRLAVLPQPQGPRRRQRAGGDRRPGQDDRH